MRGRTGALKPAAVSASDRRWTRGELAPSGSPSMKRLPYSMLDHAGLHHRRRRIDHAADAALRRDQPPQAAIGIDGLQLVIGVRTGTAWKYHQGMPFIAVTTAVSGPSSGCIALAIGATEWAFSVTIT